MTDDTLRKVTLNLFASDVEELDHMYGHGWSVVIRDLVRQLVKSKREPKTVGDIVNGE